MESYPSQNWTMEIDDEDLKGSEQIQWASSEITRTFHTRLKSMKGQRINIRIRSLNENVKRLLDAEGIGYSNTPESFSLIRTSSADSHDIDVIAHDTIGIVYGLLELADLLQCSSSEEEAYAQLTAFTSKTERTAMPIRSVTRLFVSEEEDKGWFYSPAFWDEYLTNLVMHRFNRFHLALGIGYDSGHDPNVVDNYFCFAYPFLLQLPQYDVKAVHLPTEERERNLEALRYISEEAKRRGLHFQLGLWTHAHAFLDSPNVRYPIQGITKHNHALYCRDALQALLQACPAIDGVTLRVHYESGIPEPASEFWKTVMEGARRHDKRIELDMHAKGVDEQLIHTAVETGSPVLVSAKYAAEHMGLPYHQADIRQLEKPRTGKTALQFDAVTATSRRFTRYGYGDFLQERRSYDVIYRLWPGTQRLLLWGDPQMAAGFGRLGRFGGAKGIEWFEPLSFKARKNSGTLGGRDPYASQSLQLKEHDWKKYQITYRLMGRLLYNPDTNRDAWSRYYRASFGEAAPYFEKGLAAASRILPLITTAYLPSAANNIYWPEMYTNQAIVAGQEPTDGDFDTPAPYTFGTASPLDPQLFYAIDDYVTDHLSGKLNGKITPVEVADWLSQLANEAQKQLQRIQEYCAGEADNKKGTAEWGRFCVDIEALSYIGQFFKCKIEAAILYAYFKQAKHATFLHYALNSYREAKASWEQLIHATDVYKSDLAFGYKPYARGHWQDRLEGIEKDIAAMEREHRACLLQSGEPLMRYEELQPIVFGDTITCMHVQPVASCGEALSLSIEVKGASEAVSVDIYYRPANQAASYTGMEMTCVGNCFYAQLPPAVTSTGYPLIYYFIVRKASGAAKLWPGFEAALSNQPYYTLAFLGREELG